METFPLYFLGPSSPTCTSRPAWLCPKPRGQGVGAPSPSSRVGEGPGDSQAAARPAQCGAPGTRGHERSAAHPPVSKHAGSQSDLGRRAPGPDRLALQTPWGGGSASTSRTLGLGSRADGDAQVAMTSLRAQGCSFLLFKYTCSTATSSAPDCLAGLGGAGGGLLSPLGGLRARPAPRPRRPCAVTGS